MPHEGMRLGQADGVLRTSGARGTRARQTELEDIDLGQPSHHFLVERQLLQRHRRKNRLLGERLVMHEGMVGHIDPDLVGEPTRRTESGIGQASMQCMAQNAATARHTPGFDHLVLEVRPQPAQAPLPPDLGRGRGHIDRPIAEDDPHDLMAHQRPQSLAGVDVDDRHERRALGLAGHGSIALIGKFKENPIAIGAQGEVFARHEARAGGRLVFQPEVGGAPFFAQGDDRHRFH